VDDFNRMGGKFSSWHEVSYLLGKGERKNATDWEKMYSGNLEHSIERLLTEDYKITPEQWKLLLLIQKGHRDVYYWDKKELFSKIRKDLFNPQVLLNEGQKVIDVIQILVDTLSSANTKE
jgi:hypothetical protein